VLDRLPQATIVSVAHRVELEAFHTRKLVLEYQHEGARLVDDDDLMSSASGRVARFLSSLWNREKFPKVPHAVR
jgi:putative ATP-binding cassette transporter